MTDEPVPDEQSPEDFYSETPAPLGPYNYPIWVYVFGIAVIFVLGFCALSLPHDIALARKLHEAKELRQNGKFAAAEEALRYVLREMPDSKSARLEYAQAIFEDGDEANDEAGLAALTGIKLDSSEWARVSQHMPEKYRQMFSKGN